MYLMLLWYDIQGTHARAYTNFSYNNNAFVTKIVNFNADLCLVATVPRRKTYVQSNVNIYIGMCSYVHIPHICINNIYIHMFLQRLKVIKCVCARFFRNLELLCKFLTTNELVFELLQLDCLNFISDVRVCRIDGCETKPKSRVVCMNFGSGVRKRQ